MHTLIPNDKRRREAAHRCIVHLSSMHWQAEAVRAASEWQDRVVQRRLVDRQPEMVRTFTQGDWAIRRISVQATDQAFTSLGWSL